MSPAELDGGVEAAASILKNVSVRGKDGMGRAVGSTCSESMVPNAGAAVYAVVGGARIDDEHVTVWEPATGKTVAGNAAPYRRNLTSWLRSHPGWEEKADELKSSKRRSAARRAKAAASSFAVLCSHTQLARSLLCDIDTEAINTPPTTPTRLPDWSPDEYIKLEEALVNVAEHLQINELDRSRLAGDRWETFAASVSSGRSKQEVVGMARYILERGISSQRELAHSSGPGVSVVKAEAVSAFSSPPGMPAQAEQGFRAPREPRVTVWEPATGRTVSGNAAPCKRNVAAWIAAHPGWEVKRDEQLSVSRRAKKQANYETDEEVPGMLEASSGRCPESPPSSVLSDALEGLLCLCGQRRPMRDTSGSEDSDLNHKTSMSSSMSDGDEFERRLKRPAPMGESSPAQIRRQRLRPERDA